MHTQATAVAFQKKKNLSSEGLGQSRYPRNPRPRHPLIAVVLCAFCALFAFGSPTYAADQVRSYHFDITDQTLSQALRHYGQVSGQEIIFTEELLTGLGTTTLKGDYTASAALNRLLQGTGLTAQKSPSGALMIRRPTQTPENSSANLNSAESSSFPSASQKPWWHLAKIDQDEQNKTDNPSTDSTESVEKPAKLEEITVTAQKRVERLQDVPISIAVLRGEDLDRSIIEGVRDALNTLPGVATTVTSGGGTQVAVRGVTASGPAFNGSSPIAYYLDWLPFGLVKTAIAPDVNAYDLERVEVLRGPQGTLYGASAQNGVVRILTRDANPDAFEFKARTLASSTDDGGENYRGDLALNVPLIEGKLAARAVVGYEDLSGWVESLTDEDVNDGLLRNMRLKVKAQPTESLSIDLSAWASRVDYGAPSRSADTGVNGSAIDEPIATDTDAFGLRIGYDFSAFSLASTTSYLDYANDIVVDFGPLFGLSGIPLFTGLDSEVFSQEVILNSPQEGAWRWSLGGIYRDGEDRLVQLLPAFLPAPIDFYDLSESFAVFGELTHVFLDGRFELTGGLRYFEDDVVNGENVRHCGNLCPGEPLRREGDTFDKVSPRVVMNWHPSDQSTLYASYSEGFRSGFPQNANTARTAPQFPALKPDNLKNYEFGAKGSLWNGRMTYDAAAYFIDWQDVQQTIRVIFNGAPITAPINGESASGPGFEFAATTRPFDGLQIGIGFSWNDLSLDKDVPSGTILLFEKGDRLNLSPEYTAGASVDYAFPIGGGGFNGRVSAAANYLSEQNVRTISGPAMVLGISDAILVGRFGFTLEAPEHWAAGLFVDNITNEDGAAVEQPFPATSASRIRPRTVGVQLEYRFR